MATPHADLPHGGCNESERTLVNESREKRLAVLWDAQPQTVGWAKQPCLLSKNVLITKSVGGRAPALSLPTALETAADTADSLEWAPNYRLSWEAEQGRSDLDGLIIKRMLASLAVRSLGTFFEPSSWNQQHTWWSCWENSPRLEEPYSD